MQPVKMTRAEYEAKYGAQVPTSSAPIKMTRAEYNAKYGNQPVEQSFADKLLFNKPTQNVPEENNGSVGSFVKNFASAAYKNVADPLTNRMNEVSDRALATGQSPINTGIQAGGALAGTALDVSLNKGTDMAISGVKTAQDYAKGLSKYVPSSIANYKNELPTANPAPTEPGIATKALGKAGNYAFNTFPEQHPTAAGTAEAAINILGVLPGEASLRAAGTNLAKGASKTIEATTPLAKATKQAVINKIAPGPEILNTKVDKQIVNIFKGTTADSAKVADSAFKAKKGLDLLVQNAKTLNVADINAPLGSGVTKALDIKKATPNEILSGVFEMDKKIATLGREAASNATKEGIKLDTLPAQKIIANAHNEGKLSTPATNNLMRQLEATQGDPTKIHDWIQDQVNIRYFTKAGSLEDSAIAKYANDAADSMRTNLNKVVDRAGYAEAYGNNQELKRMLVTIAKKANKKVNFGDIATDAGLDAAISVITGNPEYMARTVATGLFRGILSSLRNQSGMKSFKKAAAMLEDIPPNARLPRTNTKIDYSLPRLEAGPIKLPPTAKKGSFLVTNADADPRTMSKTLLLPEPDKNVMIPPNRGGTPNPLGRPYKAGGEPARIGGVEQRLPLKSELKVLPDTLEGITDATDFDKLSSKERDIITKWLNKQPDEYLTNKQQTIKNEIEVAKGTVDTMTDVYANVLGLEKYISKSGQYKGEFRFEDGSKGKFAKGYDEILSNAFNQYSTNGKLTESEMIDKYFSIKKTIQEQKDTIKQLQTEYKKIEALQPYKKAQSSTVNLPTTAQITTKANVSGEGKIAKIPSNMNNVIKKSPGVIKPSILPKADKSSIELDLAQEAKKYKSAEEFIKAQGTPVYHGTNKNFSEFQLTEGKRTGFMGSESTVKNQAIFLSDNKNVADFYGKNRTYVQGGQNRIIEAILPKGGIIDLTKSVPTDIKKKALGLIQKWEGGKIKTAIPVSKQNWLLDQPEFVSLLKEKGFVGVKLNEGAVLRSDRYTLKTKGGNTSYAIFDPSSIKTKSQLEKIWGEAQVSKPSLREAMKANKGSVNIGNIIEDIKAKGSILREGQPKISNSGDYFEGVVARERFNIPALKKISFGGSDRDVYDLEDGKVLKVVKTARGIRQNDYSHDYYAEDAGLIPKTYEVGDNYIVKEKVYPPDARTKAMIKDIQELPSVMRHDQGKYYEIMNKLDQKYGADGEDMYNFSDLLNYGDILVGDLKAVRNWGVTKEGKPILLDEGTLNGQLISGHTTGNRNLDNPEFRNLYNKSKQAKKLFADRDSKTMYSAAGLGLLGANEVNKKVTLPKGK